MKECIIYGAGRYGEMAFEELKETVKILFFVDSDNKRWGEKFCGIEIKSPNDLSENKDKLVVVAVKYVEERLLEKCKKFGVQNLKVYYPGIGIDDITLRLINRDKPGILVEASLYAKFNKPTGQERLMYNVMNGLSCLEQEVIPVTVINDSIVTSGHCKEQCIAYKNGINVNKLSKVNLIRGDKIIFLGGNVFGSFHTIIDNISNLIESYVMIWDIRFIHQEIKGFDYYRNKTLENFNKALTIANGIICFSKTIAEEIINYYYRQDINRSIPLKINVFPLGFDLNENKILKKARSEIKQFLSKGRIFLMVGSIRTYKGYKVVLKTFQNNFRNDENKLLIIGQKISDYDIQLADEIKDAENELKNILWIDDATDDEVSYCYENATALIQASFYEGYGLPLIEAAQYGLPLICSDIPIFREVSCGYADFFKVGDAEDLARTLKRWMETDEHPDSRKIPLHTWKESAETLVEIVEGKRDPYAKLK